GPVYAEMIGDGVNWTWLGHVAQDAYLVFAMDEQVANDALAGGQGEAGARGNRATRRAAKKTVGRKSHPASTATATRTRRQGSTGSSTSPAAPADATATG